MEQIGTINSNIKYRTEHIGTIQSNVKYTEWNSNLAMIMNNFTYNNSLSKEWKEMYNLLQEQDNVWGNGVKYEIERFREGEGTGGILVNV